jgi:uncharacterized protein YbjT (DUF2867 family)
MWAGGSPASAGTRGVGASDARPPVEVAVYGDWAVLPAALKGINTVFLTSARLLPMLQETSDF